MGFLGEDLALTYVKSKVWREPKPSAAVGVGLQKNAKGKCGLHKELSSETVFIPFHILTSCCCFLHLKAAMGII